MIWWLILAVYLAGYVYTARRLALAMGDEFGDPREEGPGIDDRVFGALAGLLWPLLGLALVITGKLPPSPRRLQRRITELEHELGMKEK